MWFGRWKAFFTIVTSVKNGKFVHVHRWLAQRGLTLKGCRSFLLILTISTRAGGELFLPSRRRHRSRCEWEQHVLQIKLFLFVWRRAEQPILRQSWVTTNKSISWQMGHRWATPRHMTKQRSQYLIETPYTLPRAIINRPKWRETLYSCSSWKGELV